MKRTFLVIGLVVVLFAGLYIIVMVADKASQQVPANEVINVEGTIETYTNADIGFEFSYVSGDDGYVVEEVTTAEDPQFVHGVALTPTADYEDQQNRVGGESSPAWRLYVYNNHLKQSPSVWVDANPLASNVTIAMGMPREEVVAGANAVAYTIDGLYKTDVVVVANGGYIFIISKEYINEQSSTFVDFSEWLSSITFIPTLEQMPSGKINVQVACESALAYTTFMNSEDSDKFIAECIDGKHPDVIDRFIEQMNLGEDVVI